MELVEYKVFFNNPVIFKRCTVRSSSITSCNESGSVSGLGSAGVTVALSGGSTATVETDADGNYTFSGLKVEITM